NVSTTVDITERAARELKPVLPAVTRAIGERVAAGEQPDDAIAEVIAESRRVKAELKAERDRLQAENDRVRETARAALPASIQRAEASKAANGSRHAAVTGRPSGAVAELEALNAQ